MMTEEKSRQQNLLAIQEYEEALPIATKMKDRKQITNTDIQLGDAYYAKNQFELAIKCYEKALGIEKTHARKSLFRRAHGHIYKALRVTNKQKHELREANAYDRLAHAYMMSNRFEKAILITSEKRWKLLEHKMIKLGNHRRTIV